MVGCKLRRVFCLAVCFAVALILSFLYIKNSRTTRPAVGSVKKVAENSLCQQFDGQIHDKSPKEQDKHLSQTALTTGRLLQEFRHEWIRQHRARVDWMNIARPCADQLAWDIIKEDWGKINRSNAVTSDVIFQDIRPAGEFSKIFIQSRTSDNRTKTIGGDTWRVYVRGPSSVAATVFDHNNGTYEALFLIMEPGVYQLMIYLDYSLCDGFKDPPRDWFIKGDAQGERQKDGILGSPLDEHLVRQPFMNGQPLKITVPKTRLNISLLGKLKGLDTCFHKCKFLWDGFGQWRDDQWRPHLEESYTWNMPQNYTQSGTFWIYGDSLGFYFFKSVQQRSLCTTLYKQCKNSGWVYPVNIVGEKWNHHNRDFKHFKVMIIEHIVDVLRRPEMKENGSVLLLNLVIHFTKTINFTSYQNLIDDLILALKETEVNSQGELVPKYRAKVIWKSGTAIHKEKAKRLDVTAFRFFTSQREALFSAYSTSAMCKAGFDVIDVYPLTDSYPHGTSDHVHYKASVFDMLERLLEHYKVHNNKRLNENEENGTLKRCISQEDIS